MDTTQNMMGATFMSIIHLAIESNLYHVLTHSVPYLQHHLSHLYRENTFIYLHNQSTSLKPAPSWTQRFVRRDVARVLRHLRDISRDFHSWIYIQS